MSIGAETAAGAKRARRRRRSAVPGARIERVGDFSTSSPRLALGFFTP